MKKRIYIFLLIAPLLAGTWSCAAKLDMEEKKIVYQNNKIIPESILNEAKIALSYYPDLEDIEIEFRFKEDIKKSFMQAQPKVSNLFKGKDSRSYYIFMSSKFLIEEEEFSMADVPSDVLIGWLGHELGHIMDYREKSAMGLVIFGMRYVTSSRYIKEAERAADTYAVNSGMGDYIIATKDFILNHSHLSESYKERIARLYLSPEEILVLVNELEERLEEAEKEES
ncbi:hypothetical protein [Salinimicrobium xinjiangense]|uniref:hypothetical protein n=1 Tax=Salinimicrobium xinjiangense TaxID=438596 RepID=UPI00041268DF